jgi:hypothetical protein
MKTSIIILAVLLLASCQIDNPNNFSSSRLKGDASKMTHSNDTLFYNGVPVGRYTNMELECINGRCVIELSVNQFSNGFSDTTSAIMLYVKKRHQNAKLEIKIR